MKKLLPRHGGNLCRVEVKDLSVSSDHESILENVTADIRCGELTALIGPNGAGKTTFIRALLGQIAYTGKVDHVDKNDRHVASVKVGYVPQQLAFDKNMPATVGDVMAASMTRYPVWLGIGKKTRAVIAENLAVAGAEMLIDRKLGDLSGGEMQRVLLALALNPLPQLLILDEPVSGVDMNGLRMFLETVTSLKESKNLAVLLVSHDWPLVQAYADRVILLDKTVLCFGTPGQVFHAEAFSQAFPGLGAEL